MREQVIRVNNERDPNKKEELISSYAFDAMYAVQEGVDSILLKSQGFGMRGSHISTNLGKGFKI